MLVSVSEHLFLKEIFTKQEVIIESHKLSISRDRGKEMGGGFEKSKRQERKQ